MSQFTVTRQCQWPTGKRIVEISEGGLDYTNPDALAQRYPGEFETFTGMVEALETAIAIAEAWKKESAQKIYIGIGNTHGFTMPFEGVSACKTNYRKLRTQAKKYDEALPHCPQCGDIMPSKENCYTHKFCDEEFCSENCANLDWEAAFAAIGEDDEEISNY